MEFRWWRSIFVEIFGGANTKGLTLRADGWAWTFGEEANDVTWTVAQSWSNGWNALQDISSGEVTLQVYKKDNTSIKARITFENGEKEVYTINYPSGVPDSMRVRVGSDGGKITINEAIIGPIEDEADPVEADPVVKGPLYISLSGEQCELTDISKGTTSSLTCGAYNTAFTDGFEITEEGIDISFKSKTTSTDNVNWITPNYYLYTNSTNKVELDGLSYRGYFICRADLFGMIGLTKNTATLPAGWSFTTTQGVDWATWLNGCKAGAECNLKAKLVGDNVEIEFTVNGITSKAVIPVVQEDASVVKTVAGQIRSNSDKTKDLGIVTTIAKTDFEKDTVSKMGVKVQTDNGTVQDIPTNFVLKGSALETPDGSAKLELADDTYFFRTIVTGVEEAGDATITVTPYIEYSNGKTEDGKAVTIKAATAEQVK